MDLRQNKRNLRLISRPFQDLFFKNAMILGLKMENLRLILSEYLCFIFRECYDFGTKNEKSRLILSEDLFFWEHYDFGINA